MAATWAAAAGALADAMHEHGNAAADLVAAAWRARVDPDATRSLLGAASVLTSGDAVSRVMNRVPPCQSAEAFLGGAEEIEGEVASALRYASRMARDCAKTRKGAIEGYGRAATQAGEAQAGLGTEGHAAARANLTVAVERMEQMRTAVADCEAALDTLAESAKAMQAALRLLPQVPADFAEAYDVPLQYVADGGKLPWSGDFITPPAPATTAPQTGA